jgi:hypothetical protein
VPACVGEALLVGGIGDVGAVDGSVANSARANIANTMEVSREERSIPEVDSGMAVIFGFVPINYDVGGWLPSSQCEPTAGLVQRGFSLEPGS